MAYKTDGTANFNFFINRQGPRGPQGIEGEQGFSPSITEGENTAETYTLQVNNKDSSFTTPNLKPQFQDRGGDVVKVDREYNTLYFGTVDIPDAVDLTSNQTINGNKTFIGNSTFAGTSHFTDDVSITGANLEIRGGLNATSATIANLQVPYTLTSSGKINAIMINAAGIKNDQNNKYYLDQSKIVAGNNITVEETTEGVKISSTPTNMVTTDTTQTITGSKTFTSDITSSKDIVFSAQNIGIVGSFGHRILFTTEREFYIGSTYNKTIIRGSNTVNESNKKFLVQGSVTAGSDNLIISNTTDGIQLVCNAPTNAQFGQLQESIADLSTKINNLTDRVRALEEQIDGGVA